MPALRRSSARWLLLTAADAACAAALAAVLRSLRLGQKRRPRMASSTTRVVASLGLDCCQLT